MARDQIYPHRVYGTGPADGSLEDDEHSLSPVVQHEHSPRRNLLRDDEFPGPYGVALIYSSPAPFLRNNLFQLVNLIADLGGQVGLFLGMSIISGLEIVFLIILLCCYCCTHKQRKSEMMQFENDLKKARVRCGMGYQN